MSSASDIIKQALAQWGLSELGADVDRLFREGLSDDAVNLELQRTDAYKRRFAGNEARTKAGLSVLSPAEYLSVEASYRQVMQSYGLPQGFWDQPDDFTNLIGRDVSPQEVNERVKVARDAFLSADPAVRQTWRDFYGLSDGAGIAAVLDPDRALPTVNRMAVAAQAGAAATRDGLTADRSRLELYADQGYTADQLAGKFSDIGQVYGAEQGMANRFGQGFTQADSEAARIQGDSGALRRQRALYGSEQALFDQRASGDRDSLAKRTNGSY